MSALSISYNYSLAFHEVCYALRVYEYLNNSSDDEEFSKEVAKF